MIRTEYEYKEAVKNITSFKSRLEAKRKKLKEMQLSEDQIHRVIEGDIAFYAQIEAEIETYERLCRGEQSELNKFVEFNDLGKLLTALRLFCGLSQSELAKRIDVDPSQISRDEKNEYHGITVQRASRIMKALGVEARYDLVSITPAKLSDLECA